jgi:phospholipid N-methyltransferase
MVEPLRRFAQFFSKPQTLICAFKPAPFTMNSLTFFRQSIRHLRTTGTVVRSSKHLCEQMLRPINFSQATLIVELGAGDGVFTEQLLMRMRPDAQLICFEIHHEFCNLLRQNIHDSRFHLIEDSAVSLNDYLQKMNLPKADYIISGIPFVVLPPRLARQIVQTAHDCLQKGGLFIQFHYSLLIWRMYRRIFGNLRLRFVPLNFPPAMVFVCEKK